MIRLGGWKVRDFLPGAGISAGAHLPGHADDQWLAIDVPGELQAPETGYVYVAHVTSPYETSASVNLRRSDTR